MYTMKRLLLISAFGLLVACSTPAEADHSDNGKCIDEIKHWNSLTDSQKSEADAVAKRDEGTGEWVKGDKVKCEAAYKSAITLATD
tara:strand:- start:399 stop:656 length:258 start_codon:yes stop_codon:yes gene_type:complete